MKKNVLFALILCLFCGLAGAQEARIAQYGDLDIRLAVEKVDKSLIAHVTCSNPGDVPLYVPSWAVDGNHVTSNIFTITNKKGSKEATYTGIMAKRLAPVKEDCLELAPHESISFDVNLQKYYSFPRLCTKLSICYDGYLGRSNTVLAKK